MLAACALVSVCLADLLLARWDDGSACRLAMQLTLEDAIHKDVLEIRLCEKALGLVID